MLHFSESPIRRALNLYLQTSALATSYKPSKTTFSTLQPYPKMLATAIFSGALAGLLWLLLTPFRTGLRSIPGPWFRQFTGRYLIHILISVANSLMRPRAFPGLRCLQGTNWSGYSKPTQKIWPGCANRAPDCQLLRPRHDRCRI